MLDFELRTSSIHLKYDSTHMLIFKKASILQSKEYVYWMLQ